MLEHYQEKIELSKLLKSLKNSFDDLFAHGNGEDIRRGLL